MVMKMWKFSLLLGVATVVVAAGLLWLINIALWWWIP